MTPQEREYLTQPRELSLGLDPDLIARYLRGEDVTEQLLAMERGEDSESTSQDKDAHPAMRERRPVSQPPVMPGPPQPSLQLDGLGAQKEQTARFQQASSALPRSRQHSPRWSLIAVAITIGAMLAMSLWVAFQ